MRLDDRKAFMKIALWQTAPHHGPEAACVALTEAARAAHGADVLVAPEMVVGGYVIEASEIVALAARSQEIVAEISRIAVANDIAIVCGLAFPGSPLPMNGAVAIDRTGRELARCAKTHLFGAIDRGRFTPGAALSPVFTLAGWRVALAICYDIEFPEVARALALRGADAILVPTANPVAFDTVATRLVPARAEENAVCVGYANYVGGQGGVTFGGLSCICGADGADLARAGPDTVEMVFAILSRTDLDTARTSLQHRSDRRPDLYI